MRPTVSAHMSRFAAREGPLSCECFDLVSCSNGSAPPRRALVRSDPDESTVMSDADGPRDIHVAIYQTVDADADSDGPGSNRGRTHPPTSDINIGASQPKRRQELTDADVDRILSKPFGGAQSLRDANMPWS